MAVRKESEMSEGSCYDCLFNPADDLLKLDRSACTNCIRYSNWTPKGPITDAVRWTPPGTSGPVESPTTTMLNAEIRPGAFSGERLVDMLGRHFVVPSHYCDEERGLVEVRLSRGSPTSAVGVPTIQTTETLIIDNDELDKFILEGRLSSKRDDTVKCDVCGKEIPLIEGYTECSTSNMQLLCKDCFVGMQKGSKAPSEKRPSFRQIYMRMAHELSQRSTCRRLRVGCVITSTDFRKVLSVGYNGNVSGLANDCDSDEVGNCGCLHAEENAVINCDSPRSAEKIVFVTHLPCVMCTKRLINLGNVRTVYFDKEYRDQRAIEIFNSVAITVTRFSVDG
jgi:dCMP deaminase